jgi:hypothetical protein
VPAAYAQKWCYSVNSVYYSAYLLYSYKSTYTDANPRRAQVRGPLCARYALRFPGQRLRRVSARRVCVCGVCVCVCVCVCNVYIYICIYIYIYMNIYPFLRSPTFSQSFWVSGNSLFLAFERYLTVSLSLSLTPSPSPSRPCSLSHTLSLTHTHTHTHTPGICFCSSCRWRS